MRQEGEINRYFFRQTNREIDIERARAKCCVLELSMDMKIIPRRCSSFSLAGCVVLKLWLFGSSGKRRLHPARNDTPIK